MSMSRIGASILALLLLTAGCTGSDDEAEPASTQPEAEAADDDEPTTTEAAADEAAPINASVEGLPDTAVADSFGRLLTTSLDGTLSESIVEGALAEPFLAQVSAAEFVSASAQLPTLLGYSPIVVDVQTTAEYAIGGTMINPNDGSRWEFLAGVEVEEPHRLVLYTIVPATDLDDGSVTSIDDARSEWSKLGDDAQLLIEEIGAPSTGDECGTGGDALAIGSAFKFYVLGAVATAVEAGDVAWSDDMVIEDRHRSLPSGQLQLEPAGVSLTVVEAAELMMGISDNTATDHLLGLVGRDAVEAQLDVLGHSSPGRNRPFLGASDLFRLKLGDPIRLGFYAEGTEADRRRILDEIEAEPLPEAGPGDFVTPVAVDVEWFASTADLCRALVGLDERGRSQPELHRALRAGRGLPLNRDDWPTVGFKGGSEPGVLSVTWLAERADGRRFALSGIVNDAEQVIDQERAFRIMAGVFELLLQQ